MKKTIIALVALSSMALATELTDAIYDTTANAITLNSTDTLYTSQNISFVLQLDIDALKTALSTSGVDKKDYNLVNFYARTASNEKFTNFGSSVIFTSSAAATTTSSIWFTQNQVQGYNGKNIAGTDVYLSNIASSSWGNAVGASLVMTHSQSKTSMTLDVHLSDGQDLTYSVTDAAWHWSSEKGVSSIAFDESGYNLVTRAYFFNSELSADDTTRLGKIVAAAPEPATATLSLLALAGLAARRRRH